MQRHDGSRRPGRGPGSKAVTIALAVGIAMNVTARGGSGRASAAEDPTGSTSPAGPITYGQVTEKQLEAAIRRCPVAYVSAGIVEWHGEQSACGLDGLKAETLCRMASEVLGGVCFPHVWLGPDTSTPFDPVKYPRGTVTIDKAVYLAAVEQVLSKLEALGFRVVVYLSGHYPGVIPDVAKAFNDRGKMKVISISENLVVKGMPAGDHAATWETSLLMVLRPGLVDLTRLPPLPAGVKPGGEVIPPAWPFRQRCEYYGVYGSDPRVWANAHFGRCGVEAVIDGVAREVSKALGDASYGQDRKKTPWPKSARRRGEVRYDHLLPYQWIERFTRAPIVHLPLPAARESIDQATQSAVDVARKAGGMVFPAVAYGPRQNGQGVAMSVDVYEQIVKELVAAMADMDFRVIALYPGAALHAEACKALRAIRIDDGQSRVIVVDAKDGSEVPSALLRAVCEMIPAKATSRAVDGEWRINGERTIKSLSEGVYGPADRRVYEITFGASKAEAVGAAMIDLGVVENHCELVVNDSPSLIDHWPPYRFLVTGRIKAGPNRLRIIVHHRPQPTLDTWFYRVAPPRLVGPVRLTFWKP
jgi:creatinine amidohydrolase/Fe(II)-dependent formamide hydrolase-like protein